MRAILVAAVILALFHGVEAPRAAEPLAASRVLGSQLRLSSRLVAALDAEPARRDPNIVISPASLAAVMALLDIGADNKMRSAIFNTLGLTHGLGHEPPTELAGLRATVLKAAAKPDEADFQIANAIMLDPQSKPYGKVLARLRDAGAEVSVAPLSDLAAIRQINDWVAAKTNRLIPAILQEAPLPPGFVAVNALYFKGRWPVAFARDDTRPRTFHAPGGDLEVPMMSTRAAFAFRKQGRFAAVEMPYRGGRYTLVLVTTSDRPAKAAEFASVNDWLGGAGFTRKQLALSLPRFTLEEGEELLDPLKAIGLRDGVASPTAFEGLSALPQEISRIVQKTYLRVDEEGTEAAAATGVVAETSARPPEQIETLVVDRPFLFGLRDTQSGLMLMSGYIAKPTTGPSADLGPGAASRLAAQKH